MAEDLTPAESADPIAHFHAWMEEAERKELNDPNAMAVATADAEGRVSLRMVLLKGVDHGGFVFYTNLESRKGRDLAANMRAALGHASARLCSGLHSMPCHSGHGGQTPPPARDSGTARSLYRRRPFCHSTRALPRQIWHRKNRTKLLVR